MSAAALTPRIRILVVCDQVTLSETEEDVFTLEGVRQHLVADSFPCLSSVSLFLLLSSPRLGIYQGRVLVVQEDEQGGKTVCYRRFTSEFVGGYDTAVVVVEIEDCPFPEPGRYIFQVWFFSLAGKDALKGELPFDVLEYEE